MSKPTKFAVSYLLYNPDDGTQFVMVQRPENDANLPNVWGLPAGMVETSGDQPSDDEWEAAVVLSGHQKLGVHLEVRSFRHEGRQERSDYVLCMRQYEVVLAEGVEPSAIVVPQSIKGVTQYQQWRWGVKEELRPAADKGSLCSQLHLTGGSPF